MKKISKLRALPFADQKHVFNLCGQFSYPDVTAQLAKPRDQGGLDLETNPSALCRFNQQYGFLALDAQMLQQFVDVLKVQPTAEGLSGPIVHMAEIQIFRQLLNSVPLKQLLPEFKVLLHYKHAHLQEKKFNRYQRPFRRPEWWETDEENPTNSDRVARGSCRADSPIDQGLTAERFVNPAVQTSCGANFTPCSPSVPYNPSSNITPFPIESPTPPVPPVKPSLPPSTAAIMTALAQTTKKLSAKNPTATLPKTNLAAIDQQTAAQLIADVNANPNLSSDDRAALAQEIHKIARHFTSCTQLHEVIQPTPPLQSTAP